MVKVLLIFYWESREPASANDAARLARFVSGLPQFDSIYASWPNKPKARSDLFPVPLSEAEAKQFLRENISRDDVDGSPLEWMGTSFGAGGHAGPPPYDFRKSSYARQMSRRQLPHARFPGAR